MAGLRFGPWVVQGVLGRGGMGELYAARHAGTGAEAAVKVMRVALLDPEAALRFEREVRALFSVRHPGVVAPLDAGRSADGRPWLAMERVQGESLQAVVQRGGPMAPREAARLVERVARALDQVHAQGVVHRDIKPENILLAADGAPRIVDFGLARFLLREGSLTASSEVLGTPAYMAPEQADGRVRQAGPPADVYSLGATLFFLLTGRPPFEGASAIAVFEKLLTAPAPAPSSIAPGVPAAVEAVVLRCLEKDPGARYPTAGGLADALAALDRAPRPRRRRRSRGPWLAALGALVVVALGTTVALVGRPAAAPPTVAPTSPPPSTTPPPLPPAPVATAPPPPPSAPAPLGARLEAEGDLLGALLAWREQLRADAGDVDAWVGVARLARRTERPARAWVSRALRRVASRAPGRADVRVELAWALLNEQRQAEALEVAEAVIALGDPGVAGEAHTAAALALLGQEDEQGARRRLRQALVVDPDQVVAACLMASMTAQADPRQAERALDACVARAPLAPEPFATRAQLLLARAAVDDALADLDRAVELDRHGTEPLRFRSQALRNLGRHEEALADAGAVLRRDPWGPGNFVLRANAAAGKGDVAAAIADCEREVVAPRAGRRLEDVEAVRRLAEQMAERLLRGVLERTRGAGALRELSARLERAGATRAALRALTAAVEAEPPGTPEDAARRVDLALESTTPEVDQAERIAETAVQRWPTSPAALSAMAWVHHARHRLEECNRMLDAALALDADSARALRVRGLTAFGREHRVTGPWLGRAAELEPGMHDVRGCLGLDRTRRAGELDAGLADLRQLELDAPAAGMPPHFVALGHMARGDWRGVLEGETRSLERTPTNGDAWYYRSQARHRLGDPDGAVADMDQALGLADLDAAGGTAWALRAGMRLAQGDLDGALEDARVALQRGGMQKIDLAYLIEAVDDARERRGLDGDLAEGFSRLREALGRR